jgi:voltage-gated potassium channel Kch
MDDHGWRERLRYAFDRSMAAGTIALVGWLGLVSVLIVLVAAMLVAFARIAPAGSPPMGFLESVWVTLMRALDPGNVGGDQGWSFRLVELVVTLAGIFIVSALIGVIGAGLQAKLDQLRKGRSLVLEQDHTIIFNWTDAIFDVIAQLVIANASRVNPRIVIMADRDKVAMEDEIAAKVEHLGNTRIICRSGDPTDLYDLAIANPRTCRSIVILSPDTEDADAAVIKTILALVNDPDRRDAPYRVAAEIREGANAEVARMVGGKEVQLVLGDDLISRIMVQSTRQASLSSVYTELLDFEGCEIYAVEQPALLGKRFDDAQLYYESCSLIGLCTADGKVLVNPPAGTLFQPGARAILIAEDDDLIRSSPPPSGAGSSASPDRSSPPRDRERTLLLGWNRRAPIIAVELSRYMAAGSRLTIAADTPTIESDAAALAASGCGLEIALKRIDTSRRAAIEALDPASYDHVLVLGYSDLMAAHGADTRTLITLLHLRAIREAQGRRMNIVSEVIDVRNLPLAKLTRIDDFVVSSRLVSLMLTQASENEYMERIFGELVDEEGSEIYLRPASSYIPLGQPCSFYDVARAAAARGEVAIGHHLLSPGEDAAQSLRGIIVNPVKSERTVYDESDRIIVLARN